MSFAGDVKEELLRHYGSSRHCQIAELSALVSFSGTDIDSLMKNEDPADDPGSDPAARKCFTLLEKTFNIVSRADEEHLRMLKQALSSPVLLQKSCCRRAYLRGAFLAAGSVSDPNKSYHFEIACRDEKQAEKAHHIGDGPDAVHGDIPCFLLHSLRFGSIVHAMMPQKSICTYIL